jgi:hypothetical protein
MSEPGPDQARWLAVRAYLREHRGELTREALRHYPHQPTVAGTDLLTGDAWTVPGGAVDLHRIGLRWTADDPFAGWAVPDATHILPIGPGGDRYPGYARALAALAPPAVFINRTTYRLRGGDLRADPPWLAFGPGRYFDGIDLGESFAHELTAAHLGVIEGTPMRDALGDPGDPARRPTNIAISALTLRHDRATGQPSFPVHWRDPGKVGHAGGMVTVMPVGVFQAPDDRPGRAERALSLWRCLLREYAEEMRGAAEPAAAGPGDGSADDGSRDDGSTDDEVLADELVGGLRDGRVRATCLGLGVDPLTLATDLLVAVVIEAGCYDRLFAGMATANAEGRLAAGGETGTGRFGFTAPTVDALTRPGATPLMQAASAALLRLAWQHRAAILTGH